jgi:HD-GYP domain-containing protein (c-di-GMP phosphodiesterase class II)
VLDHHERLDGRGYPRGLKADDLDLATRILAVCDVYDALVSPRVYRDAWPVEKALAHLQSETDTSFDPRCVTALILVLAGKPSEQSNGAVQGLGPLGARLAFPS